jgi:hypothetical protein
LLIKLINSFISPHPELTDIPCATPFSCEKQIAYSKDSLIFRIPLENWGYKHIWDEDEATVKRLIFFKMSLSCIKVRHVK